MNQQENINITDLANLTKAVRLGVSRGAFQMEEIAQLLGSVQRIEKWVEYFTEMAQQEQESTPAPTENEPAEEQSEDE